MLVALSTAVFTALSLLTMAEACSIITSVHITFYGAPDNDPPGPATAYNCGGRNYIAGGTGTYANPLTFASAPGEYNKCKLISPSHLPSFVHGLCERHRGLLPPSPSSSLSLLLPLPLPL